MANLDVVRSASCTCSPSRVSVYVGNRDSFHLAQHRQIQLVGWPSSESWWCSHSDGSGSQVAAQSRPVVLRAESGVFQTLSLEGLAAVPGSVRLSSFLLLIAVMARR